MIGLGVDVVDLDRFRRSLARRPSLVERLFSEQEQAYAERRRDPVERYAVRFAAKEAVMKAMDVGIGAFAFQEVEVVRADSGAPAVRLHGGAAALAARLGVTGWRLSLSHSARVAVAAAVALGAEPGSVDGGRLVAELRAADPARTAAFWEDVLGFHAQAVGAGTTVLTRDGGVVEVRAGQPAPAPRLVVEVPDLGAAHRRAARHVGPALPAPTDGSFTVVDPDGVEVRVRERGTALR